jgi:hypothetical protein
VEEIDFIEVIEGRIHKIDRTSGVVVMMVCIFPLSPQCL